MINNENLVASEIMIDRFKNSYLKSHYHKNDMPLTISFLITNRCNLKCKHCFNRTNGAKACEELTFDEYERLSKSMSFFSSGLFCGGEPFIRDDMADIINLFRKNNNMQWASTTTNGLLTDAIITQTEKICSAYRSKRFVLNFSLDGYEKDHDLIRGEGIYKKAVSTIKEVNKLKKKYSNLSTGIVSTMTSVNQYTLADFFDDISYELDPNVISLLLVRQSPRDGEYLKEVEKESYVKAKRKLEELFLKGRNGNVNSVIGYIPLTFYDDIEKSFSSGKREFYCYAGKHGAYIDFDGKVNACEVLGDEKCNDEYISMGNLRDYDMDFLKLWNSEKAEEVRNKINRCETCEHCTHETEGILPSVYFEPNSGDLKKKMYEMIEMEKKNAASYGISATL